MALVPSAADATVVSITVRTTPSLPVYAMNTGVPVPSPVPLSVTAWPGLADGSAPFAGVPLMAVDVMLVTLITRGALVPPAVVTVIGPIVLEFNGTDRLTVVPLLKTSGP